jgi:hypothetical protein
MSKDTVPDWDKPSSDVPDWDKPDAKAAPEKKSEYTEGQTVMVNGKPRTVVMVDGEPRYKEDVAPSMGYKQVTPESKAAMTLLAGTQAQGSPLVAASELLGFKKPAEIYKQNSDYAKSVAGNYASGAELGSEIFNPFTLPAMKYAKKGIEMIPKVKDSVLAMSGGLGATQALLTPMGEDQSKAEQLGWGTAGGALLGKAGQMLLSPKVSAKMKELKDMGMSNFTPGQLMHDVPYLGAGMQKLEQYATSLPFAGSIIASGIENSYKDFNRALGNKVLEPLGLKVPKDVQAGNDLIQHVKDQLENSYDMVTNSATFRNAFDPIRNTTAVESIWNRMTKAGNNLVPKERETLQRDVVDNIVKHIEDNTVLNGTQFRAAEKYLGKQANAAFEAGSEDLGFAYQRVQDALRTELQVQNPQIGKLLEKAHDAFRRFLPVEKAAAMRGANEGVFTPQQFKSAAESSAGKSGTASGKGLMVPESQAGIQVLGKSLPSSGTTERALTAKGVTGGAAELAATAGIPAVVAGALYNPITQKLLSNLATGARPEVVQKMAPFLTQTAAQVGGQMAAQPEQKAPLSQEQPFPY